MIIESYPTSYQGYPFLTLLHLTNGTNLYTLIDNTHQNRLKIYDLNMCVHFNINELQLMQVAHDWWTNSKDNYPISIEFSKRQLSDITSQIYKNISIDNISRIVGPTFSYDMDTVFKVKRKRRVDVSKIMTLKKGIF